MWFADTRALLQKKINSKRMTIPSQKARESASDLTDDDSISQKKFKNTARHQDSLIKIVKKKVDSIMTQQALRTVSDFM